MHVYQREVVQVLMDTYNLNRQEATCILNMVRYAIVERLKGGHQVRIREFGVFTPTFRKGKRRKDNLSGKVIDVKDAIRVKFKPVASLISTVEKALLERYGTEDEEAH